MKIIKFLYLKKREQSMSKEYDVNKLKELIDSKDVQAIKSFMKEYDLIVKDGYIVPEDKTYYEEKVDFFNLKQYVTKIFLNSLYGATLQSSCLFYDMRIGASTTCTGRMVVRHLTAKANELLCGKYEPIGYCAEYNDTDSVYCYIDNDYFKQYNPNFVFTKENIIDLSNDVAYKINDSFKYYMMDYFHCTEECALIQKAAKECVASKGIFCGKKRYAMAVYEHDGFRKDAEGGFERKIMGIQVSRSDCPKIIRDLLKKMLESVLTEGSKEKLIEILKDFGENKWKLLKPWEKGSPKACNKLAYYTQQYNETKKCSVGQVMAAINWNRLIDIYNDGKSPKILDGNKVIVCKLKPNNQFNMSSVAYPLDINALPEWFKKLPFDEQSMKDSVVDQTIDTVFGVLGWKLTLESAMNEIDDLDGFLTFV